MFAKCPQIFCLVSAVLMLIPGEIVQAQEEGQVIVISERVGETIDREERNYYGLFLASWNFHSAVIRQLPDGSYLAEITEGQEGEKQVRTLPIDQNTLDALREHIENYTGPARIGISQPPASPTKEQPPTRTEDFSKKLQWEETVKESWERLRQQEQAPAKPILTPMDRAKIKQKATAARKQAKILAQEKWTRERWREESRHDQGPSYRGAGAALGFTLGAAAGMLIGKGLQERKVERTVYHPGEWEGPPAWTEEFYSYKNRHAPIWGGAIGGLVGGVTGYYLSKNIDKEYYILVPKDIRVKETNSSKSGCLFGFGLVGPIVGAVAGHTLYMPMSGEAGKYFGWPQFVVGYLAGGALGSGFTSGYAGRAKHKQLWEESLLKEEPESSLKFEFMPLDPTAFALLPRQLPSGEVIYEYRMDMLRVRF